MNRGCGGGGGGGGVSESVVVNVEQETDPLQAGKRYCNYSVLALPRPDKL